MEINTSKIVLVVNIPRETAKIVIVISVKLMKNTVCCTNLWYLKTPFHPESLQESAYFKVQSIYRMKNVGADSVLI